MSSSKARFGPRVAANMPVALALKGCPQAVTAYARDIGIGGICIATRTSFAKQLLETVSVRFPAGEVRLQAEARWQRDAPDQDVVLTGVRFCEEDPATQWVLWSFVQDRAREIVKFLNEEPALPLLDLYEKFDFALFSRLRDVAATRSIYGGAEGNESLFVIFRGRVALRPSGPHRSPLASVILGQGSIFGGIGLVATVPTLDRAESLTSVTLLELDAFAFRHLRSSRPDLARRLVDTIVQAQLNVCDLFSERSRAPGGALARA